MGVTSEKKKGKWEKQNFVKMHHCVWAVLLDDHDRHDDGDDDFGDRGGVDRRVDRWSKGLFYEAWPIQTSAG